MKNVAILGSTGSIGRASLRIIESNPDKYRVVGLACGKNVALLKKQIESFHPAHAAVLREDDAKWLRKEISIQGPLEILSGEEGFLAVATSDNANIVISAISGAAGLIPTYSAISARKDIALANKETLVMAGSLIISKASAEGVFILPIDSEHSAIFQCLQGHSREDLKRIILTGSGGPFLKMSIDDMKNITPTMALRHPNWKMGKKVTIDSATLMNKGLEAIEARWLFDLRKDQISILIHPQSIIHSMVEYIDGSILAQLGIPDMMTPISYALSYPRHLETGLPSLRLEEIGMLTFEKPDLNRFRCLQLCLWALEEGRSMPAVLNGANEVAVDLFLKEKIRFLDIPELIEKVMSQHQPFPIDNIGSVLEADQWARRTAFEIAKHLEDHK